MKIAMKVFLIWEEDITLIGILIDVKCVTLNILHRVEAM